jgi:hypothetical protein
VDKLNKKSNTYKVFRSFQRSHVLNLTYLFSSISSFSTPLNKEIIMQALREIYDVTSDTLTIKIPPNLSYPKAEVIILFLDDKIAPIS